MNSNSSVDLPTIDVELSEKCINQMKQSEADEANRFVAVHIVHAAPSLFKSP